MLVNGQNCDNCHKLEKRKEAICVMIQSLMIVIKHNNIL